jgi:hypothetical protein
VASQLAFSCDNCQDNCCDSYFQHHTYIEWTYLWEGLHALADDERHAILVRAAHVVTQSEKILAAGERPNIMCPLNRNGLCLVYSHRMMICRLHGVPTTLTRPDGRVLEFPGCFRCQEVVATGRHSFTPLERAALYKKLAELEMSFLGSRITSAPKVKLTLAQMLVYGPPTL